MPSKKPAKAGFFHWSRCRFPAGFGGGMTTTLLGFGLLLTLVSPAGSNPAARVLATASAMAWRASSRNASLKMYWATLVFAMSWPPCCQGYAPRPPFRQRINRGAPAVAHAPRSLAINCKGLESAVPCQKKTPPVLADWGRFSPAETLSQSPCHEMEPVIQKARHVVQHCQQQCGIFHLYSLED